MFLRDLILWLSTKKRLTDFLARRGMRAGFAQRFVAGEKLADAIGASLVLQKLGYGIILNHLGENVTTREEAARTRDSYIEMIHALETARLRGNISIKPTQLGLDLGRDLCQSLAIEIAQEAKRLGRTIEVDMESSAYTERHAGYFRGDATGDRQRGPGRAGLYAAQRSRPGTPRATLAENSIGEGSVSRAGAHRVSEKREVDENYCRLADRLLGPGARIVFSPRLRLTIRRWWSTRVQKSRRTN